MLASLVTYNNSGNGVSNEVIDGIKYHIQLLYLEEMLIQEIHDFGD